MPCISCLQSLVILLLLPVGVDSEGICSSVLGIGLENCSIEIIGGEKA